MLRWLEVCERWLTAQYKNVLGTDLAEDRVRLRWLSANSLTEEVEKAAAQSMVIEDRDVGLLLFLLPYHPDRLEPQVSQAIELRSRLLREANYTGDVIPGVQDDPHSSWRISLIWLVADEDWVAWQARIMHLRRASGAVEEVAIDAVRVKRGAIEHALDAHGMPKLLLNTRALLAQSAQESEQWLSVDEQVLAALRDFSQRFGTPPARAFAHSLEKYARACYTAQRRQLSTATRQLRRFSVKQFRNLAAMEIAAFSENSSSAQAIVLFGPNGTGKSSLAEAVSLAAFGTSTRMEQYLDDKDIRGSNAGAYLRSYLTPLTAPGQPTFVWNDEAEQPFSPRTDAESRHRAEGVVLSQEDTLQFTQQTSEALATRILKGYSSLADQLSAWIGQEEKRSHEVKLAFTRKNNLNSAVKRSDTAYDRLAQGLLQEQFDRPSRQFMEWLPFASRVADEDGQCASQLTTAWINQQENVMIKLAEKLVTLQVERKSPSSISDAILEHLVEYDSLAVASVDLCLRLATRTAGMRERLDQTLAQMDRWGEWLASRNAVHAVPEPASQRLQIDIEKIAQELVEVVKNGKILRARLELLEKANQFLSSHWTAHPETCPVCASNVADRQGIEHVVMLLRQETGTSVQTLRQRYDELQEQRKKLEANAPRTAGTPACPLTVTEQGELRECLEFFLPRDAMLEDWLIDPQRRKQLKDDLNRMRFIPDPPRPHAEAMAKADQLAESFIALTVEADRALEDPQAIAEVKKAFEVCMEEVLTSHLPATLGKVWREIAWALTTAPWLLPAGPALHIGQRGKRLSVQLDGHDQFIRYIYNSAERHVLGLAWFFTDYLARRRYEDAWMLLDDPAQEMDQPSFREFVRFCETLLRLHNQQHTPFTLIMALHQEERALAAARATNGRLYVLGWQEHQDDSGDIPSVKKVILLAPGFHPAKPEKLFRRATTTPTA